MRKVRAYLELVRLPNLFTAVADVIAGFAFGGGNVSDHAMLALLAASSVCLYAGGVTLNDVCDSRNDSAQRPHRPIPSGRVTLRSARRLAIVLLIAGIALAAWVSVRSGIVALALCICIVLYDVVLKRSVIAPSLMGLCRSLNFSLPLAALGVTIASPANPSKLVLPVLPVVAIWLYVTSLTVFAKGETIGGNSRALAMGTVGVCFSALMLVGLHGTIQQAGYASYGPHDAYLAGVVVLVLVLAFFGTRAVRRPEPECIQRAVGAFVVLLIGLDVCIAWASRGGGFALAIGGLFIPALILGSRRVGLRIT